MKPKIIFTIANYNTRKALGDCLESIRKTQNRAHKVFVIDNASTDGSAEMVKQKYPEVRLIQNEKNIGFGAAHNIVLKSAEYDFAVITNSDIVFLDGIEKTLGVFSENKKIGACTIKLLNVDGSIQKIIYPMPNLKREIAARVPFLKNPYSGYDFNYEKPSSVECFNGACFILNKKALEQAGYFDEDFFAYGEETELFYRMKKCGWKIFYCPNTKAIHLGGQTTKDWEKKHSMYFSNLLRFFRKSYGLKDETCLRFVAAASALANIVKCAIFSILERNKLKEAAFNIEIIKVCLRGF